MPKFMIVYTHRISGKIETDTRFTDDYEHTLKIPDT